MTTKIKKVLYKIPFSKEQIKKYFGEEVFNKAQNINKIFDDNNINAHYRVYIVVREDNICTMVYTSLIQNLPFYECRKDMKINQYMQDGYLNIEIDNSIIEQIKALE